MPCHFFGGRSCYAAPVKNQLDKRLTRREMVAAWRRRDAGYDGVFCFGVRTTGIFCRPSCPSQPQRKNLEFFRSAAEAVRAGYRSCKRCQPELASGQLPQWIAELMAHVETRPQRISARDLRELGIAPERARRWFLKHRGMTFAAWCRGLRLAQAFTKIGAGRRVDEVVFEHGYESHSGFREAFTRIFGSTPGRVQNSDCLYVGIIETPLGPMLAAVNSKAVCHLEFADHCELGTCYTELNRRWNLPVVPGDNQVMRDLRTQLREYFQGRRKRFNLACSLVGTSFQQRVWRELQQVTFGQTTNYAAIANRIGVPSAVRAVARANATNRVYLIVPCHRVIAKDGALSGYGGGVWRKRMLLDLERTGKTPL